MLIFYINVSMYSDISEHIPLRLALEGKACYKTSGMLIASESNMDFLKLNSPFLDRFSDIH